MISMNEFMEQVKEEIVKILILEGRNIEIAEIIPYTKHNDELLYGLAIKQRGELITPQIYLDDFYKEYQNGKPMEKIIEEVKTTYDWGIMNAPRLDLDALEYEKVKDKIVFQIVDIKENKNRLMNLKHTPIGNGLAMTYGLAVASNGKIPITNEMAEALNYPEDKLYDDAIRNTPELYPPIFDNIVEHMRRGPQGEAALRPFDDRENIKHESDLYILTNKHLMHGAAAIFYPEIKEQIAEFFDDNYYVLPCSIHEVILIPEKKAPEIEELEKMVEFANDEVVLSEDFLSNNVYKFDKGSGRLEIVSSDRQIEEMSR